MAFKNYNLEKRILISSLSKENDSPLQMEVTFFDPNVFQQ